MTNLTISVDEEILKRARIRALKEDTSVNAVLGDYLKSYACLDELQRNRLTALERVLRVADQHPIDRSGNPWGRDELHER